MAAAKYVSNPPIGAMAIIPPDGICPEAELETGTAGAEATTRGTGAAPPLSPQDLYPRLLAWLSQLLVGVRRRSSGNGGRGSLHRSGLWDWTAGLGAENRFALISEATRVREIATHPL